MPLDVFLEELEEDDTRMCSISFGYDDGASMVYVCFGFSPLTQIEMVDFVSGRAVIDVAQRKFGKNMAKCAAIGYGFLPFSFSSLGELEADAVVKVYVSVFGDERGKEVAISGLKSKAKYVRGQLGKRMKLRLTPEIRFIEDESLERGSRVIAILDKIKSEKNPTQNLTVDQDELSNPNDGNEDWEDDDPDDDIIYVK
nr:probable ribosome-binding factor A, chloroplastic [Tanacetum cinerariifolium]